MHADPIQFRQGSEDGGHGAKKEIVCGSVQVAEGYTSADPIRRVHSVMVMCSARLPSRRALGARHCIVAVPGAAIHDFIWQRKVGRY
jgi:hypothetical protein